MRTQLEYLLDMSTRPNIAVHVVPASVGAHAGLLGAFIVADLEGEAGKVVYLETPDQGLISDAAEPDDQDPRHVRAGTIGSTPQEGHPAN